MLPQPENPSPAAAAARDASEFSHEERHVLVRLAHRAIEAGLEGLQLDLTSPTPRLALPRGAFTTLYLGDELRGCVGYVSPAYPLYRTIAETAQAAAFNDTRFWPVTREEAPFLKVQISVLSPVRPIIPAEVEVGLHGLIVSLGAFRGLLLPQVPVECGWDRETFLAQTCRKAGLPDNAWQRATLEAFTAEVFGDVE